MQRLSVLTVAAFVNAVTVAACGWDGRLPSGRAPGTEEGGGGGASGQSGAAAERGEGGEGGEGGEASTEGRPSGKTDVYDGRRGQPFNLDWRFHLGDSTGAEAVDFDDSSWRVLNVPHDFSIELPFRQDSPAGRGGGYLDGGTAWYRKRFVLPETSVGQRVFIRFDGVYMDSTVWVDGELLGGRPYGYSSFGFEMTGALTSDAATHVVAVRVNHQQPSSRWYSGSGIYRNVWLTVLDPVHVAPSGVFVHFGSYTRGAQAPTTPGSATAVIHTDVVNQSEGRRQVTVSATLVDADGTSVATGTTASSDLPAAGTHRFEQSLTVAQPELWSPSAPYLYEIVVQLRADGRLVDTYRTETGIRTLHFDPDTGLYLNGQNLKVLGVALHHDLGALGAAFNYRAMQRRIEILKGMGANAIRTAHNPPAPELLEICDRLGMLVMDEAFDCWETGKTTYDYARFFNEWAETDLKDMVRRDRNHPCVIMWSAGNEIPSPTVETARRLKDWILEEDPTRPVTWGRNSMQDVVHQQITDQVFDLAGMNYPSPELYDSLHEAYPSWCSFGSEVMSGRMSRGVYVFPVSQRNYKTSPDWGSSYDNCTSRQAMTHDADFSVYQQRPFLFGEFLWAGFDYIGESDWPLKSYNAGKIDTAGFPKQVYYFYRSQLSPEPLVHILPHWNWEPGEAYFYTDPNPGTAVVPLLTGTIPEGFVVTVVVYANTEEVELFLDDASLGTQRFLAGGPLRLTWEVPWKPGTLRAVGRTGGQDVATDEVTTAGPAASVALSSDRRTLFGDGEDLAFVTAEIRDAEDTLVPRADNRVRFSVSGPGEVIAVDNGDASDTDPYQASTRRTFAGKCLAIVRATGEGQIEVTASSAGLSSSSVTMTARAP